MTFSSVCGGPAASASPDLAHAVEAQTVVLSEVLRVLVDIHTLLGAVATSVASGSRYSQPAPDIAPIGVEQTSQSNDASCYHGAVGSSFSGSAGQSPVGAQHACEELWDMKAVESVDDADAEEEEHLVDHLRDEIKKRTCVPAPSEDASRDDPLCAFGALEAFSTDKAAAITAADLVSTTRALGLEQAFVETVGQDLNETTVKLLFTDGAVDLDSIPFDAFHKVMTGLSQQRLQPRAAGGPHSGEVMSQNRFATPPLSAATGADPAMLPALREPGGLPSGRRPSLFTTQSYEEFGDAVQGWGGRLATLQTQSEVLSILECIIIEPQGPPLGAVICLHGLPPSRELLDEWGRALGRTGWLELGLAVALPNVQMSAALQQADLETVVEATLDLVRLRRSLLVGAGWGAQRAVELATSDRLEGVVAGLVLAPWSSTAPHLPGELAVPVVLTWGLEDGTPSYSAEEAECWIRLLDDRCAPTLLQPVTAGSQRMDQLLADAPVASRVRRFTAASLLMAYLADVDAHEVTAEQLERLRGELPDFLRHGPDDRADLLRALPYWIQAGLPMASE